MSNRAMSWAWENAPSRISTGELLLLVALADQADDHGETYPSIEYLARKVRAHIDTVKRNLNGLISAGLVVRTERLGRSNVYRLAMDPPANYPPADCTPPQNTPGLSAGGSGPEPPRRMPTPPQNTPPQTAPPEPKNFSTHLPLQGVAGGVHDSQPPAAPPKRSDRGTRLPETWTPPVTARTRLLEQYPGRSNEWWLKETEKFVNYFISQPGARGRRSDWTRTWENWIHKATEYAGPTQPTAATGPDPGWAAYRAAVNAHRPGAAP